MPKIIECRKFFISFLDSKKLTYKDYSALSIESRRSLLSDYEIFKAKIRNKKRGGNATNK